MLEIFTNLVGLLLSLMIVIHIWITFTAYRQNISSVFIPIYIYLNILIIIFETCAIFQLQDDINSISYIIFKIQLISIAFIPPIIFYTNQNYLMGTNLPAFNSKNIVFFIISLIFSGIALGGFIFKGVTERNGIIYPVYNNIYWLYPIFFYITFGLIIYSLMVKFQAEKRKPEIERLKVLLTIIIPLTILCFSCAIFLPLWDIIHPSIFLIYILLSLITIYLAFKFQIIEIDDNVSKSFIFFEISAAYFFLMSLIMRESRIELYFISIPFLLLLLLTYHNLQFFWLKSIKNQPADSEYSLEDELEVLVTETDKYIDNQALSQFIGDLSLKVLRCTKCAVITSRFDIRPYQIIYINGFQKEEIEELLSKSNSPFIETLEYNRVTINKFDLNRQSSLYQMMERFHIYLGIPLVSDNDLLGFILLGGERKLIRISNKDLKFAKFLSLKAAYALKNIDEIQNVVQSQKMADLGIVASQLAHDFQSFISLVKIHTRNDDKLFEHANYMEKLVRDLLNYTKPKDLRLDSININQLIDMTLDLINIPENISIEKHYSDSIPQINVDSDQMRRVFLNLFENSIGAIKNDRGRIKITTRPLRPLSNFRRNTWLYVEILDDGAGIPEEFLEKIFEPFFTTRKQDGGNGMGLAIVRQIITRHKGFIDVTSKLGKGTIFNIRLPYLI